MAGLGEVYSHVGATLFYLMSTPDYRKRSNDDTCNDDSSQVGDFLFANFTNKFY